MSNDPTHAWQNQLGEVLITREEIAARVAAMGAAISRDYAGQKLVLIGILRGTFFFIADLLREITVPASVDFISISRYGPTERTQGVVRLTKDLDLDIEGQHVLFVEDIVDTGLTLAYLLRSLKTRHPASISVCALLDRPRRRLADIDLAYVGFEIPDCWVVGYGMDYREALRQLPYISVFTPPGRKPCNDQGSPTKFVLKPAMEPRNIATSNEQRAAS